MMRRWEHMAVGQTDCKSYREAQEWVAKKAIESGDRGYELVGFDISRCRSVQRALARDRDVQAPPGLRPGTLCLGVSSRYFLFTLCLLTGVAPMTDAADTKIPGLTFAEDWPRVESVVGYDPGREAFIADVLSRMTLEEKVGQMIQPDLREVTPDEVTEYRLGTILNGGGAFPGNNKYATAADWAQAADTLLPGQRAGLRGPRVPCPVRVGDRRGPRTQQRVRCDPVPPQHRARRGP